MGLASISDWRDAPDCTDLSRRCHKLHRAMMNNGAERSAPEPAFRHDRSALYAERFLLPARATMAMMVGAKEDAECQLFLKA
jgi:hypothetical protein